MDVAAERGGLRAHRQLNIAGLLMAERAATRGTNSDAQSRVLFDKVGSFYPVRENFHLTAGQKAAFTEKLKAECSIEVRCRKTFHK
jgi:hypothetical protein